MGQESAARRLTSASPASGVWFALSSHEADRMPRARIYRDDAARSAAYRRRLAARRNRDATNDLGGDVMAGLAFIRDSAGSISRDNLANWAGWRASAELHCHALQDDLDRVIEMLDALLNGDTRPFDSSEFQAWRASRRTGEQPTR
jgi:hypothetical protein